MCSSISKISINTDLFAIQEFGNYRYVMHVRGGRIHMVLKSADFVHSDMRFASKMPGVVLKTFVLARKNISLDFLSRIPYSTSGFQF